MHLSCGGIKAKFFKTRGIVCNTDLNVKGMNVSVSGKFVFI